MVNRTIHLGKTPLVAPATAFDTDPAKFGANTVLSNSNRTATTNPTEFTTGVALAVAGFVVGGTEKRYAEYVENKGFGIFGAIGLRHQRDGNGGRVEFFNDGTTNTNGAGPSSGVTWSDGDVIAFAVDFAGEGHGWVKNLTTAGDWNGSPTNDPATGTGGIIFNGGGSMSGTTLYLHVVVQLGADFCPPIGEQATVTFAAPFVGTVPSGFTGFGA